jgi:hypothetical protein
MPYSQGYGPPILDWSGMSNIVQQFQQGREYGRTGAMRREMSALDPSDPGYMQKATAVLQKYHPEEALKYRTQLESANALAGHRAETLKPPEQRLLEWWQTQGGGEAQAEPMRVGPAGSNLENAPAFIQDKFMSARDKARQEAEGKTAADQTASAAMAQRISQKVQGTLDQFVANVEGAENDTFENALGPWQGVPDAETWQGAVGQLLPQTAGAVANWASKVRKSAPAGSLDRDWMGEKGQTTGEMRATVHGTTATLVNLLKPYLRVKGEGAQSDRELLVIQQQLGDLAKSKTKPEFYRRLQVVTANMRGLGLDVNLRLPGQQPAAAPMDMATDPPPTVSVSPPMQPGELPVYNQPPPAEAGMGIQDPRGAYFPNQGQPQGMNMQAAPDNTIITNGKQRLIKRNGQWVPL